MKPVCQGPDGAYSTIQSRAKAYPSTRILEVLQGLGDQAVVGSICPADITNPTRQDYGYSPVINAVVDRLRQPRRDPCLSVALPVDANGQTPCSIVEVSDDASCQCDGLPGRRTAPESLLTDPIRRAGSCRCEIQQLTGSFLTSCLGPAELPGASGWCYVDPAQERDASCELVETCRLDRQRRIRFSNAGSEPRAGAEVFLRCEGEPVAPLPSLCP
jgi:hypothetical protein